jgi:hypothetical protein
VRGIIRQLCGTGRVKAEITGEQVLEDGQVLLRYRIEEPSSRWAALTITAGVRPSRALRHSPTSSF